MKTLDTLIIPENGKPAYVFFSGKGGVGKTTISASTAVWLADRGYRTLILSTDLQRSLDDIFEQRLEDSPTKINGYENLFGVTIDPAVSIQKHRGKVLQTLELIDPNSTMLKQMKADTMTDCGCAQAALFEFMEYLGSNEFDAIVFDTAPLGAHLEKLAAQNRYALSLTQQLETKLRLKEALGAAGLDEQISALREIIERDERAVANLRSEESRYILVMIPENMPFREVERNLAVLETEFRIPVKGIVINQIIPEEERHRNGFWEKRSAMQRKYVDLAHATFAPRAIGSAGLLETETIGTGRLRRIGNELFAAREAAIREAV